jgi:hypothetical protein
MAYTLTTWTETGMSTTDKVNALNNLETIYSEVVDYIDAITHSASYYTDAQAAALFFTADTDGEDSGLIAATLDGLTAQQIIDSGTPSGCIGIWSSTEGTIPAGWYLCDGLNGTPNLQDRFVVGAGGNYTVGATGGSDTVTSQATITVGGHELAESEIPKHTHGTISDSYPANLRNYGPVGSAMVNYCIASITETKVYTEYAGGGESHGHTASFAGTVNQDHRPPFYALCYVMKA